MPAKNAPIVRQCGHNGVYSQYKMSGTSELQLAPSPTDLYSSVCHFKVELVSIFHSLPVGVDRKCGIRLFDFVPDLGPLAPHRPTLPRKGGIFSRGRPRRTDLHYDHEDPILADVTDMVRLAHSQNAYKWKTAQAGKIWARQKTKTPVCCRYACNLPRG